MYQNGINLASAFIKYLCQLMEAYYKEQKLDTLLNVICRQFHKICDRDDKIEDIITNDF